MFGKKKRTGELPMPPMELREMVGPTEDPAYDNPTGKLIWGDLDYGPLDPGEAYRRVFDFGCGCGREARQLLLQKQPPQSYVGVDISRKMIKWCKKNLGGKDVTFHHHDVWHAIYAPENRRNRMLPIQQHGRDFTLVNAHSVFTHLVEDETRFYLNEIREMLAERALLRTTWFFFNRDWFPPLAPQHHCLYIDCEIPTRAVYFDWQFFVELMKEMGFRILDTQWTETSGFQSLVMLGWGPGFEDNPDAMKPTDTVLGFGYSKARDVYSGPYGRWRKAQEEREAGTVAT